MSEAGAPAHPPIPIGAVAAPPFVRLPEPTIHFRLRAQRFAILSQGNELEPYLRFMAGLAEAQHRVQEGLPEPDMPSHDDLERAQTYSMPPLDRGRFTADSTVDATFDRLFALATQIEMPAPARLALDKATALDPAGRMAMARAALAGSPDGGALAEHAYVSAALQVHFARLASRLDPDRLVPVGEGACPACGGPPVSSLVVGWQGAHGTRFCACSLCSSLWHVVRVKCTCCGSTGGIVYEEIEKGSGAGKIRAETCQACKSYVKIMLQHEDPALDPVADDVATLGLDILLRESGMRRGGVNPFLLGY